MVYNIAKGASALVALLVLVPALSAQGVTVKEAKPGLLKQAKVSVEEATATAQAKVPAGKVKEAEIEREKGHLVYSFDFKTEGKAGVDEVLVDAITGKVRRVKHESPAAEAKEKVEDKAGQIIHKVKP